MTELVRVETPADAARETAGAIAAAAVRAVRERGAFSLALAGGTTPRASYAALAEMDVPWSAIDFFFGDERAVPADHAESNYKMAKLALFDRAAVRPERVHRMRAEGPDLDAAARAYAAELPERLDFVLLGMGEDGHTASLFPGSPAVGEWVHRVVATVGPKPPPRRLTITPAVIGQAREVVVVVTGASKATALARALEGPVDPKALPIQLALGRRFIIDRGAAALLKERP